MPSIAGPKRPQDRIRLSESKEKFEATLPAYETDKTVQDPIAVSTDFRGDFDIKNGDVAIAVGQDVTCSGLPGRGRLSEGRRSAG